jgi:hypothetical protein
MITNREVDGMSPETKNQVWREEIQRALTMAVMMLSGEIRALKDRMTALEGKYEQRDI